MLLLLLLFVGGAFLDCFVLVVCDVSCAVHTPSITFWHLPQNSTGIGYATEGVLFISAKLSTDAVSALIRKVWVLLNKTVEAT